MAESLPKLLAERGYECFTDIPLGGKFPNLIAVKDSSLVAFEVKKHFSELDQGIGECLFYLREANQAYIVIPYEEKGYISQISLDILRDSGIGLILSNSVMEVVVEAKTFGNDCRAVIERLRSGTIETPKTRKEKSAAIKNKIVEVLGSHPEGLSICDIAKYIFISRQTATKYIFGLVGEGILIEKDVGTSKRCYLNGVENGKQN
jgi:hypothetical protein